MFTVHSQISVVLSFCHQSANVSIFPKFPRQPRVSTTLPLTLFLLLSTRTVFPQGTSLDSLGFSLHGPLDSLMWAYNSWSTPPTTSSHLLPSPSPEFPSLAEHHDENHLKSQNLLTAPFFSTVASIVLVIRVRVPKLSLTKLPLKTLRAEYTGKASHRFHLHVLSQSVYHTDATLQTATAAS